jgi:hypothetical protein
VRDVPAKRDQRSKGKLERVGSSSNKRTQLTKREYLVGRPAARAVLIKSRFAADPRCYSYSVMRR